jgi:hypothetical protein
MLLHYKSSLLMFKSMHRISMSIGVMTVFVLNTAVAQIPKPIHVKSPRENKMNVTLSAPKSPQEMWERILMLIGTNHGFVSKRDIERIIGIKFEQAKSENQEKTLGADYMYKVEKDLPNLGLVQLDMSIGGRSVPDIPASNDYSISWGLELGELSNCLNLAMATHDLENLGFKKSNQTQQPGTSAIDFSRPEDIKRISDKYKGDEKYSHKFNLALPTVRLILPFKQSHCVVGVNTTFFPSDSQ